MSSQDSDDLSQTPSPDNLVIVGGDDTSKEQSLPPNPYSQVQSPQLQNRNSKTTDLIIVIITQSTGGGGVIAFLT